MSLIIEETPDWSLEFKGLKSDLSEFSQFYSSYILCSRLGIRYWGQWGWEKHFDACSHQFISLWSPYNDFEMPSSSIPSWIPSLLQCPKIPPDWESVHFSHWQLIALSSLSMFSLWAAAVLSLLAIAPWSVTHPLIGPCYIHKSDNLGGQPPVIIYHIWLSPDEGILFLTLCWDLSVRLPKWA